MIYKKIVQFKHLLQINTNENQNKNKNRNQDKTFDSSSSSSSSSASNTTAENTTAENTTAENNAKQMEVHTLLDLLLDPKYCEHDAYQLFSLIMVRMEPVFCPSDEHPDTQHTTRRDTMSLLQRFSRVQAEIVHLENKELAEHMIMCGVEPHMYLLRWMRIMLSREFNMPGLWLVSKSSEGASIA